MECEAVSRRLQAYLDGELDPAEAEAIGAHVACCAPCAALESEDRQIRALIRAAAPGFPRRPAALNPGLLLLEANRLQNGEVGRITILKRVAAAAAALLLASGLLIGWSHAGAGSGAERDATIQAVAASSAGTRVDALIDEHNSIVMALAALWR